MTSDRAQRSTLLKVNGIERDALHACIDRNRTVEPLLRTDCKTTSLHAAFFSELHISLHFE
ncbi:hypothetical protein FNW02_35035 [Komarekiella sp. 'clone 1']|uniref:Uncharacterized protein n=1 Tax=Komarekiella delphini-convector SJRDD-AB1 TaxID=2593771 RepID=A0AA40T565_9NOST|nr:hypothetical protein [Komarekiella delphini-convector]MBD6620830.1 hypothetical protein [Komarekiella delphini-convector SJRDD-AB1]